ncbi:hypothetical protein [Desulfovibrio aminophilus]|uniref:hypothetical protein n=1 Tax=Desulfovibrio aminophilus TaxID=81425 RepID=UPI00040BD785|nr:hypothetical protein [Desulfovibrio aminophilus]
MRLSIGTCPCCRRPDMVLSSDGICFVCRGLERAGHVTRGDDGRWTHGPEGRETINGLRRDMGLPPLGDAEMIDEALADIEADGAMPLETIEEEIMGKSKNKTTTKKAKGTCRFCGRGDMALPAHGACGMCYGLIRSKEIDTETGELSAVALDRIDAARVLAGLTPLNAVAQKDQIAGQAFKFCGGWSGDNICGDPAPGSATLAAANLTFSAEPTAVSPEEREFLASGAGAAVEDLRGWELVGHSVLDQFFLEWCERGEQFRENEVDLYERFMFWWKDIGWNSCPSRERFAEWMRYSGFTTEKKDACYYLGLRLLDSRNDAAAVEQIEATLRVQKARAVAAVHRARARVAEAREMSLLLVQDGAFLNLDGQRLPLVRRARGSENPYLLVTSSLREMVLPQALNGMVPAEARNVLVYGQAGAGVLALLPIAHDDKDALPLRTKKDRPSGRTIYAEAMLRDLKLKPGRYPARVLETGIIAVDLTSAA